MNIKYFKVVCYYMEKQGRTLSTIGRTIDVIEALQRLDGARVTELSDELDMAASTVHAHLATLEERELVAKTGDEYRVGLRFLRIGKYTQQRSEAYELAEKYTRKLEEATGYRAIFLVEEHGHGVFLYRFSGEHKPWTHTGAGERGTLHSLAAGKAILAHYPEPEVRRILEEHGMPERTENTVTDVDAYLDELESVRQQGVAFNDCENFDGIRAVAVPALDPNGRIIGSFCISGPRHTMPDDEYRDDLPQQVMGIVDEYELELTL